jgi:uncharacterized glyoxalase superfamily protein PhnB
MPSNPPENFPRISPYLYYRDVAKALDWLGKAFGFRERMRLAADDGSVNHAEMDFEGGVVMLGCPGRDYRNPADLGHSTQSLYIYVDDVDEHFERARQAGAEITQSPEDQSYGDRRYGCVDPEGHSWWFATHVRDVPPEEMHP